jgi:hypothetical protein
MNQRTGHWQRFDTYLSAAIVANKLNNEAFDARRGGAAHG